MIEKICDLLNLDIKAGLGRRLLETEIRQDVKDPTLFYIHSKEDISEAFSLAHALSVLAEKVLNLENVHFKAERILACH
ncbi:MAG: hypothetical protein JW953_21630 [Anaerolineae bacterium]|nr:hypothetical protein [Anaerolineae bacterium]